jgi:hypothetical protein
MMGSAHRWLAGAVLALVLTAGSSLVPATASPSSPQDGSGAAARSAQAGKVVRRGTSPNYGCRAFKKANPRKARNVTCKPLQWWFSRGKKIPARQAPDFMRLTPQQRVGSVCFQVKNGARDPSTGGIAWFHLQQMYVCVNGKYQQGRNFVKSRDHQCAADISDQPFVEQSDPPGDSCRNFRTKVYVPGNTLRSRDFLDSFEVTYGCCADFAKKTKIFTLGVRIRENAVIECAPGASDGMCQD